MILCLGWYPPCGSETRVMAARVSSAPVVDGLDADGVWRRAQEFLVHDLIAGLDVRLKAVYTDQQIFFLVRFPDPDESRLHKPWIWNPEKKLYEIGPQREDSFVFKWAMNAETKELSVFSDQPHMADIWFWKADRTDPAGYADDKIDSLFSGIKPKSMEILSLSGKPMSLLRSGDQGEPAYKTILFLDYQGETIPQFEKQAPSGSRADIQAKGVWSLGYWTVEFARSLDTGHTDDVRFDRAKPFLFGISRYEIAGREPDLSATQPLYGAGDVSETLVLVFGQ